MHGIPRGLVFAIYYTVLAAIGVPANLAVIVILSRRTCGLSRCILFYLLAMAVTDLLTMVTVVILNRIVGIYFPFSFLSMTSICSIRAVLNFAAVDISVWLTVAFTFDRFVAISCQKLKITYCAVRTAAWVTVFISAMVGVKNTFMYLVYEPMYVVNNVAWFCGVKAIFYKSPAWAAYDWIRIILTPCLPFILILLLNALTVRHILAANRARRRLRIQSNGEKQSDPEMEKRRTSIVLLFAISGSFILLYLLFFMSTVYARIADLTYSAGYDSSNSTSYFLQQIGHMLQLLSSCINPFIYAGTQKKFRGELNKGVEYPVNLFVKIFKL
ncbi:probable G-protein coupled receptor 139 [Rhincodon typus]|uniref:probable G-protein coupled receptor 139 n=1 Tax=Rhincodon typus TaxID=259920 RepID=UPI00202E260B|nr:probable G-protein coupled receptor 139 [Rhincodon typus]